MKLSKRTRPRTRKARKPGHTLEQANAEAKPAAPLESSRPEAYRCSRCGMVEDMDDSLSTNAVLPKLEDIPESERWWQCPDEGPERAHLGDPNRNSGLRIRNAFMTKKGLIRLCSPYVSRGIYTREDGVKAERMGPAVATSDAMNHWLVQELLREHGPFQDVDLDHIPSDVRFGISLKRNMQRDKSGRWHLTHGVGNRSGEVAAKVRRWCRTNNFDIGELARIESCLNPFGWGDRRRDEQRDKATLYVSIDMRLNLDTRLDELRPVLRAIQEDVLRLAGRKFAMQQPDPDLLYRDIYCYLLSTYGKQTAKEIAAEVSSKPPDRGAADVRKIISNVRRALAKAGYRPGAE